LTTYTATVRGGTTDPRVKDVAGNALPANFTWSFTTVAGQLSGLVAAYGFNEGSGSTVADASGNLLNGTITGATWTSAGRFGSALSFDGVNDLVTVNDSNLLDLTTGMTLEAWVKPTSLSGWTTVILKETSGELVYSLYGASDTARPPSSYVRIAGTTTGAVGSALLPVNGWSHLAATYDGATLRLYVNGLQVGSLAVPGSITVSTGALRFAGNSVWGEYFAGLIDEIRIYNRALSQAEIQSDMSSSVGGASDTTPPTVIRTSPANGAAGVTTSTTVTVTFDEPMDPATINTSSFELRDPSNTLVPATVTYNATTRTATLTPSAALAFFTTYTVTVKGGTTDPRVKDAAGNALAANFTWLFTTTAPPPSGQPVLVITSASNPFTGYYTEILQAEGLNTFTYSDISSLSAATLSTYDVVILGEMPLTTAQVAMFTDWVNAGGNLIAMRPDKKLAGLLGLTDASSTLSNAYLLVNTSSGPGVGIVGETIQFHGSADLYTLSGATSLATLYSSATAVTSYPAVTLRSVGTLGGQAAAFIYDLARSIVYTRQGNPAWAGQDRDGIPPIRSTDMFYGAASGDPQPDWVDLNKVDIPQADEQQRLLVNLIHQMNLDKKPLPRFWYFPRGLKAVVIMTGDDHATGGTAGRFDQYLASSPPGCSVANWECVRSSSYIYSYGPLTEAQAALYHANGFEVGLHVDTGCSDYTPDSLDAFFAGQLSSFRATYPSLPSPSTNRTHCVVWSDWASQPAVELAHGIRLDTTYYYYPPIWVGNRPGFFTGSGIPMRFAALDGTIIDVYQAATQMTDESGQSYPFTINELLDKAIGPEGYYGAFTANMHTDFVNSPGSDAIVASALARGIPVVSGRQMLAWLDGRNSSSFGSLSWNGTTLSFTISVGAGANGLEAMVPTTASSGALTGITRNGSPITYTTREVKGIQYAVFPATAGTYQATYTAAADTTPPIISSVSALPASGGTATITWNTNEASDSRVDYGTSPSSLTLNAQNANLVTSHSIMLTGLAPNTTYYYRVTSRDSSGNSSTSPPTSGQPANFTTPPGTTVTAFPSSTVIQTGTLRGGSAANLNADDDSFYEVNSTTSGTRTTSWYAAFTGVSNSLSNLRITYKGKNSLSCTQTVSVWRWTTSSWVQLDSRSVGTTEVLIADLAPTGTLADYVSGTSGDGELRVRIRCTTSVGNFFSSGDLARIVYDRP
jgi:hypothetical protein